MVNRERGSIPLSVEPAVHRSDWSACYAPHSSIYFDQFGKARACCQNSGFSLGDVTKQSLREIWESAEANAMRSALENGDYGKGCEFCAWQEREGNSDIVFARGFDSLRPSDRRQRFPTQMEFALTNTCNLQCVMCDGNWSSAIRSQREGRPEMERFYGDAFFSQLAEFLPHLQDARFLGGEPFLGAEALRVMEMLAELPNPPRVTITTNGTIYTKRVKRLLERLNPDVVFSIDGASTATFDRIRVGAHFPKVIANLERFQAVLGPAKVSITHCLMVENVTEFADLLQFAEERELHVGVNVVQFPPERSLYHLPIGELAEVVQDLQACEPQLSGQRREIWDGHLGSLTQRLTALRRFSSLGQLEEPLAAAFMLVDPDPRSSAGMKPSHNAPLLSDWKWLPFPRQSKRECTLSELPTGSGIVVFDIRTDGVLRLQRQDLGAPVQGQDLDGEPFESLLERMGSSYGSPTTWAGQIRYLGSDEDRFAVRLTPLEAPEEVWWLAEAQRDATGELIGARHVVGRVADRAKTGQIHI